MYIAQGQDSKLIHFKISESSVSAPTLNINIPGRPGYLFPYIGPKRLNDFWTLISQKENVNVKVKCDRVNKIKFNPNGEFINPSHSVSESD